MGVTIHWDNPEKTIIRYDFADPWTWEELVQVFIDDDALLDSVDHPVHLVFNAETMRTVPSRPLAVFRDLADEVKPRTGLLVIAGNNLWFQKLGEIFYNVYGVNLEGLPGIKTVSTLAEARALIANYQTRQTR